MRTYFLAAVFLVLTASKLQAQYGPWLPSGEYTYREFNVNPLIHLSAQIQKKVAYKGKTVAWRIVNKSPDPINVEVTVQYIITCDGSPKIKEISNARPIQPGIENAIRFAPEESDPKRLGKGFQMQLDYCLDEVELKDIIILKHNVEQLKSTAPPPLPPPSGIVTPPIPSIDTKAEPDRDKDLIPDKLDWCPEIFGLKQFHGCPPPDRPQQILNVGLVKSLVGTVTMTPVTLSESNYDSYIADKSHVGEPETESVSQYGLSVSFNRFFGNKRVLGALVGLQYDYITFNATLNDFHVEYKAVDAGGTSYRRRVFANGPVVEKVKMQQLRIPIELVYADKLSEKVGFFISAGPLISLSLSGSSSATANFNYEAIYSPSFDNNIDNNEAFSNQDSDTDWLITEEFVNQHSSGSGSGGYFNDHQEAGYEVRSDEPIDTDGDFSFKTSIGLIAEGGVEFDLSDNSLLRVGIQYIGAGYKSKNPESFQLTDKIGDYNSMLNGLDKMSTSFISLKLGLVFNLQ